MAKRKDLSTFKPLPGVRGGKLRGPFAVKSPNAFLRELETYRVVSDAGDHGSVTVWRDDSGAFRCEFCRWCATVESKIFTSKASVRRWLATWHPRQSDYAYWNPAEDVTP